MGRSQILSKIYLFVQNDFIGSPVYTLTSTQIIPAIGVKLIRENFIFSKFGNYLYNKSALYPLFFIRTNTILSKLFPKYFNVDYHINQYDEYSYGLKYNYETLQNITKNIQKYNASFIIMNVPYVMNNFPTDYNFSEAKNYNLTVFELRHYLNYKISDPETIRHIDSDSKYWHDNIHFNLKGNEIIADYVYAALSKEGYLEEKKT